jgi:hypothetical protein
VKVYGAFLQDDYSRVREYQNRLPYQGAVIVTFTTTRQEADTFIRENGMDVARKKHADTDAASTRGPRAKCRMACGATPPPGPST